MKGGIDVERFLGIPLNVWVGAIIIGAIVFGMFKQGGKNDDNKGGGSSTGGTPNT